MALGFRSYALVSGAVFLLMTPPVRVGAQCIGDCNGDNHVTPAEISTGVQIALLELGESACPGLGDDVAVDVLVDAVNSRINGCPPTPTPSVTPTVTPTPTVTITAVPTNTPGGVSNAVASGAAVVAKSLGGIPSLVTAIVTGLTHGGASALDPEGGAAGTCPGGGEALRACIQGDNTAQLELRLSNCAVTVPDGTLTFNTPAFSPITLVSASPPASCPSGVFPGTPINAIADVIGIVRNLDDDIVLNTRATLTAVVVPQIPFPPPVCVVTGAQLTVTGPLSAAIPNDGGSILNFLQTNVTLGITSFNQDCVPVNYTLTFNGPAQIRDTGSNELAPVTFSSFVVRVMAGSTPTTLEMDGGLNFGCIEGAIALDTIEPLSAIPGQICPTGGLIHITSPEGPGAIHYLSDGSVEVDVNNDGTFDNTFSSCIDPTLQLCPQQP